MTDLQTQMHEDRMLRDAAKRMVKSDVAYVKGDMSCKGLGGRFVDRIKDGASELSDNTHEYADTHRAQVGTGIAVAVAAFFGWKYREQLADAVYDLFHEKTPVEKVSEKAEQLARDARSYFD
ncbi:hypothetical protein [Aurantiacibacter rhizosphaerae]|uniref:Uncharacterized protein n=1 Tax=Aurantiacibacter rhizosphaerae TaxID=2691582 RepID=A0A844XEH7_9SPHN|nr:hypothetical protein [Aurantiacibacter rhizosphaerae]MWV28072.1 hypothetical protein [Aurantiacibacter rhizosphaerae]